MLQEQTLFIWKKYFIVSGTCCSMGTILAFTILSILTLLKI